MNDLHALMYEAEVDMTIWFRGLAEISMDAPTLDPLRAAMYDAEKMRHAEPAFVAWLERYARRVRQDGLDP